MLDSKELWLELKKSIPNESMSLGQATTAAYLTDPKMLCFIASRYKFVSKLIAGTNTVLEVGCGDCFGAPIVAQSVKTLHCTDIDPKTLQDCKSRLSAYSNIDFSYHDFRAEPFPTKVDAFYSVDVLEHIYPSEEEKFLENLVSSLTPDGFSIWGTPNIFSEQYASKYSKLGHVNLKDHESLKNTMQRYFKHVFLFSMNDEVIHTGYHKMSHYLWALCVGLK